MLSEKLEKLFTHCTAPLTVLDQYIKKGLSGQGWGPIEGVDDYYIKQVEAAVTLYRVDLEKSTSICIRFHNDSANIIGIRNKLIRSGLSKSTSDSLVSGALENDEWANLLTVCDTLGIDTDELMKGYEENPIHEFQYDIEPSSDEFEEFSKNVIPSLNMPVEEAIILLKRAVEEDDLETWKILVDNGGPLLEKFRMIIQVAREYYNCEINLYNGRLPDIKGLDDIITSMIRPTLGSSITETMLEKAIYHGDVGIIEPLCTMAGVDSALRAHILGRVSDNKPDVVLKLK
jgi:hypothetical protein